MADDRFAERAARAERAVRRLHLGRWDDVGHRLLPRLVAVERSGPFRCRPRCVPESTESPVVADIGIDLDGGIARIDDELAGGWAVGHDDIWGAALANSRRRPIPPTAVLVQGAVRLRLVVGDQWTAGLVVRPEVLATIGLAATNRRFGGRGPQVAPILAAAPRPEILVLADRVEPWAGSAPLSELIDPLLALAADVASADDGPVLPLVALLVAGPAPFPAGWILE